MRTLSKSKLMAFRQCRKRLWLSIHRPELAEESAGAQARFKVGYQVGEVARRLYDPKGVGTLLDAQAEGYDAAFERTQALLQCEHPIFEGGFRAAGALAFADVLLPVKARKGRSWRMVEVKSSASLKDYQRDDAAIQSFIVGASGLALSGVAVAHIDTQWTYPGDGEYRGLLVEDDVTDEVRARKSEVREWIADAQSVAQRRKEPEIATGPHCTDPFECPFHSYCRNQEPQAEQPLDWLPLVRTKALKGYCSTHPAGELRNVPDELLNDLQKRVKTVTLSGQPFIDRTGAARSLRPYRLPAYFMDFETIQFAVPLWKGTRPYQQIPFQFSVHRLGLRGALSHEHFLDLSGNDPSEPFAEALIRACGNRGTVFVYNAAFEKTRLFELVQRLPRLKREILSIAQRIVDLHPIVRDHFYHPDQQGSWSIKSVLPAACPDLSYDDLEGIRDGSMAQDAFVEALSPETPAARKSKLGQQLTHYCELDTYGLVRLRDALSKGSSSGRHGSNASHNQQ
jgi:hypothetical protein